MWLSDDTGLFLLPWEFHTCDCLMILVYSSSLGSSTHVIVWWYWFIPPPLGVPHMWLSNDTGLFLLPWEFHTCDCLMILVYSSSLGSSTPVIVWWYWFLHIPWEFHTCDCLMILVSSSSLGSSTPVIVWWYWFLHLPLGVPHLWLSNDTGFFLLPWEFHTCDCLMILVSSSSLGSSTPVMSDDTR